MTFYSKNRIITKSALDHVPLYFIDRTMTSKNRNYEICIRSQYDPSLPQYENSILITIIKMIYEKVLSTELYS